jgi:hypothetical protein
MMLIVIWWKVSFHGNGYSCIESFNQPFKHHPYFISGNYSFYYNILNLIIDGLNYIKWFTKSLRCILSIIIIISSKTRDNSFVMKKLYVHDGSKQDYLYK